MRYLVSLLLALAVLPLTSCQPTDRPLAAPTVALASADGVFRAAGGFAPGDSLRLTVTANSARATGYVFNVTALESGWSGLPTNAVTTAGSISFTAVHLAAWDSVHFTACAVGTQGTKQSAQTCSAVTFKRGPGPPVIGWDSSLTITQIILEPNSVSVLTAGTVQFCPYARALDGKVRFISGYEGLAECQGYYNAMPAADKLPGYPVAMGKTTRWYDAAPSWRVAVRTPRDELAHVLFASPFQRSAV
jgi:hypothetical protein